MSDLEKAYEEKYTEAIPMKPMLVVRHCDICKEGKYEFIGAHDENKRLIHRCQHCQRLRAFNFQYPRMIFNPDVQNDKCSDS